MNLDAGIPTDADAELDNHRRRTSALKRAGGQRRTAAVNEWRGILPTWYAVMQPKWELYKMALLMREAGHDRVEIARTLQVSLSYVVGILDSTPLCPAALLRVHRARDEALRKANP